MDYAIIVGNSMNATSHVNDSSTPLGDYTVTPRMLTIAVFALGIGIISAFVALALLHLIGLCTHLFFYQRAAFTLVSPIGHHFWDGGLSWCPSSVGSSLV